MMASLNETCPSRPGKSLTCCAPPKSTVSEVVLTVMSGALGLNVLAKPGMEWTTSSDNTITPIQTNCFCMFFSSFESYCLVVLAIGCFNLTTGHCSFIVRCHLRVKARLVLRDVKTRLIWKQRELFKGRKASSVRDGRQRCP